MRVRDYVLTAEEMVKWVSGEDGQTRLRGVARMKTRVARRDVDPAQTRILAPTGEVLAQFMQ
jgi:hypothetical protein